MGKKNHKSKVKGTANHPSCNETKSKYPFKVHGCKDTPPFPTHTHGLTEIGWPEFFMDPLAFGPEGNGMRIIRAYEYFKRPENIDILKSILRGETAKVSGKNLGLQENPRDLHVYCFREASASFEAVNQAYCVKESEGDVSGMRFIQIYVEGDEDFALSDDYYKGGIKG